jgi:hypothetical protein
VIVKRDALIGFRGLMLQALFKKHNSFLRPLKKKGFKEERVTTMGLYDLGKSHDPGIQQEPSRKPHTSVVDFQRVAKPPFPVSITWISLPNYWPATILTPVIGMHTQATGRARWWWKRVCDFPILRLRQEKTLVRHLALTAWRLPSHPNGASAA